TNVNNLTLSSGQTVTAGLAIDGADNLYFIDNKSVRKYDVNGNYLATISDASLSAPIDVAVDGTSGDVYVLHATNIKRFSSAGALLGTFGSGFSNPSSLALDASGNVYAADGGNATVFIYRSLR